MSHKPNFEIIELIENHENQNVELKESFRWNHYKNQIDKSIPKKITSAICGFLASKEGGKVIIGVSDNKKIIGIDSDINSYDKNDPLKGKDRLLTDIGEKIRKNISINIINYCFINFETLNDKQIIMIEVKPYEGPVIHLKRELYVRVTNTTIKLTGREAYNYLKTNYDYDKFRFDLEYAFFNAMRYLRLAKNIMQKKREKYYSLILTVLIFNLIWYFYLYFDYINSQYLFPITHLTIFFLSLNFNIDLFREYKNSSETKKRSYTPYPSKKVVMVSIIFLILISSLLSVLLYKVVNLMISNLLFCIIYSVLLLLVIIIYLLIRRSLKRDLIFWENSKETLFIGKIGELEI